VTRTLFIGGTRRGYLTLEALLKTGAEVTGVISLEQDAHETDRYETQIQKICQDYDVPVYQTRWMRDRDYAALIASEVRPDVAFVVGCRILLAKSIYQLPRLGTLAVHDSLLPRYRGFAPLNWAIINGEPEAGVTLFQLSEAMDAGDIVAQVSVPIGADEEAPAVYERICAQTVSLVIDACKAIERGTLSSWAQDERAASYTCSRAPADGWIEWSSPTGAIHNLIRALAAPYPGAYTSLENKTIRIWRAEILVDPPTYVGRTPGRVTAISADGGYVDVLTGDGVLRVFEAQREGESRVPASRVIKSVRTTLGASAADLLQRISALEEQVEQLTQGQPARAPR
jgi:methionyl-tRNA formyltransferase